MKLLLFLEQIRSSNFWLSQKTFCFSGKEYPPFFFDLLFKEIKPSLPMALQKIHLSSLSIKEFKTLLGQSILGEKHLFWLGDITEFIKAHKNFSLNELLQYPGPHTLTFFTTEEISSDTVISLDNVLSQEIFKKTMAKLYPTVNKKVSLIFEEVFKQTPTLDLNTACKLLHYAELLSTKNLSSSISYTISLLTTPQHTLFELSESFFSLNAKSFFKLWSHLEKSYPPMFWLAFWTEQIWRAYYVLLYLKQKDFVAAKKMSFKLPRNFTTKSWKNFTLEHLQLLHKNLYNIDFSIKKGSSFYSLELLYVTHFMRGNNH